MTTEEIIELAIGQMEAWAEDPAHGYDQAGRWGERGDFDCSSAVITAWQLAGVPVKTSGATYTGNMRSAFLRCGFEDVTRFCTLANGAGIRRGDVLLNYVHHTAMACGGGREVEASINEFGGTTGGQPGDQTGREFLIRSYRNYPWDCVLRYFGGETVKPSITAPAESAKPRRAELCQIKAPVLRHGDVGPAVAAMQAALQHRKFAIGADGVDGDFGPGTEAGLRNFQQDQQLTVDGVCGAESWESILQGGDYYACT